MDVRPSVENPQTVHVPSGQGEVLFFGLLGIDREDFHRGEGRYLDFPGLASNSLRLAIIEARADSFSTGEDSIPDLYIDVDRDEAFNVCRAAAVLSMAAIRYARSIGDEEILSTARMIVEESDVVGWSQDQARCEAAGL